MDAWLGQRVESLRSQWAVPSLQVHDRITSTNDVARDLAQLGAAPGTTVIADLQTHGRGRRGRAWSAPPESSLLLSMVLRPRAPGAEALLSIRLGLATARAIEAILPLTVGLKWPNDLMVQGYKVGGILCEGVVDREQALYMVAGLGLNISQRKDDWPPDLRAAASSLQERLGRPVDRLQVAGAVVAQWILAGNRDSARLSDAELDDFEQRDVLLGRQLTVDGDHAGVGQGIDADGALRVRPIGKVNVVQRVIAGTVRSPDLYPGAAP